tara:strand:+ start:435 stop:1502 length:1068 start_codon:yes stop_codon:yes gene_type:complete
VNQWNQKWLILIVFFHVLSASQQVAVNQKSVSSVQPAENKVVFQGIAQGAGIKKNSFLCSSMTGTKVYYHTSSDANQQTTFGADDCFTAQINNAIGIDMSGGHTLQLFNQFMYWSRQKAQKIQAIEASQESKATQAGINRQAQQVQDALNTLNNQQGWDIIGPQCLIITTDPIMQKVIAPDKIAKTNEVKVVAQLWYSGDYLVQLWSQDVAMVPKGASFTVQVSAAVDTNLSNISSDQADHSAQVEEILTDTVSSGAQAVVSKLTAQQFTAADWETLILPALQKNTSVTLKIGKAIAKSFGKTYTASSSTNQKVNVAGTDYITSVSTLMEPKNRNEATYNKASDSPRSIKIVVGS